MPRPKDQLLRDAQQALDRARTLRRELERTRDTIHLERLQRELAALEAELAKAESETQTE